MKINIKISFYIWCLNIQKYIYEEKFSLGPEYSKSKGGVILTQITISLCMIVKDEEQVIARCLDSVQHIV
ncbi:hypothetical protein, partial [Bacillus toyonensis]|uniref:hypothetical protein n=1 Tax=Bacillus toyonensis TaxID=155322 RepID=UPI003AA84EC3